MVDTELGKKRSCPDCAARFYDLNKDPAECPKCGVAFTPDIVLPSKAESPAASANKPKAEAKPEKDKDSVEEDDGVEIVSLDDVEEPDLDDDDDETAGIEDVELDDDESLGGDDDDTFLEDDDDDDTVPGIVVGKKPGDDEDL